jgi:hypothetical protein
MLRGRLRCSSGCKGSKWERFTHIATEFIKTPSRGFAGNGRQDKASARIGELQHFIGPLTIESMLLHKAMP